MKKDRIAVILAGGGSTRMGGGDKALAVLDDRRLVDRVIARLSLQVDRIVIAGKDDYGVGLEVTPDLEGAPPGPAAGVLSCARHLASSESAVTGFLTVPVDGPLLPLDLFERLWSGAGCAIAADEADLHPTFAYWTIRALLNVADASPQTMSLKRLAELTGARVVRWPSSTPFANINTPADLAALSRS